MADVIPRRVLVLRFGAAGDVVLTAPAVEALHRAWPGTEILFATKRRFAPLLEHNPNITRVVPIEDGEGSLAYARRLRALECDGLLDFHGKARSRLLRLLLPAEHRAAWTKRRGSALPVRLGLARAGVDMMLADRYHAAVERFVGHPLEHGALRSWVGEREQAQADALLAGAGVDLDRPLVGMSPGANWLTKRWPTERFAELARRALAQGWQVAVTGSHDEAPLAALVRERAPGAVDLTGVVSLAALGGFLRRCTAFVANDSGPMHLARALGVPTLALFGSTPPGQFDFTGHSLLFAGVPCSPCHYYGRRSCPRRHFRCMLDLDVGMAWHALEGLMQVGPRALVRG